MDKSTTVHVSLPALSHDAHPTTVYIVKTRDEHGEYVAKCALDDGEEAICTIAVGSTVSVTGVGASVVSPSSTDGPADDHDAPAKAESLDRAHTASPVAEPPVAGEDEEDATEDETEDEEPSESKLQEVSEPKAEEAPEPQAEEGSETKHDSVNVQVNSSLPGGDAGLVSTGSPLKDSSEDPVWVHRYSPGPKSRVYKSQSKGRTNPQPKTSKQTHDQVDESPTVKNRFKDAVSGTAANDVKETVADDDANASLNGQSYIALEDVEVKNSAATYQPHLTASDADEHNATGTAANDDPIAQLQEDESHVSDDAESVELSGHVPEDDMYDEIVDKSMVEPDEEGGSELQSSPCPTKTAKAASEVDVQDEQMIDAPSSQVPTVQQKPSQQTPSQAPTTQQTPSQNTGSQRSTRKRKTCADDDLGGTPDDGSARKRLRSTTQAEQSLPSPVSASKSVFGDGAPTLLFSKSDAADSHRSFLKRNRVKTLPHMQAKGLPDFVVIGSARPVKRTPKVLAALCLGKPIVHDEWIQASAKNGEFLPPDEWIVTNEVLRDELGFDPTATADRGTLLQSLDIIITPAVKQKLGADFKEVESLLKIMGADRVRIKTKATNPPGPDDSIVCFGKGRPDVDAEKLQQLGHQVYETDLISKSVLKGECAWDNEDFMVEEL